MIMAFLCTQLCSTTLLVTYHPSIAPCYGISSSLLLLDHLHYRNMGILEPIMKDIKVLEQVLWLLSMYMYILIVDNNFLLKAGVDVAVEGVEHNLKGVTFVPGDNLASQCLGGYKSLSSALCKCRHCSAVNEGMQTKVSIEYMKW